MFDDEKHGGCDNNGVLIGWRLVEICQWFEVIG